MKDIGDINSGAVNQLKKIPLETIGILSEG